MASPVISRRSSVDEDDSSAEEGTLSRRASVASMRQALDEDEERQRQDAAVAALAQQSAAVQQLTFEQLKKFHDQQEEMVQQFSGYLQEQFENQLQLKGEYDALRAQMEQQKQQMAAHTSILREASEKVGHQAREIETLRDVVHHPSSPRGQVRWGWFAQPPPDETDDVKMEDTAEDGHSGEGEDHSGEGVTPRSESAQHLTFAMGTNTPTPPVYKGSSRQEKKAFMDSYLVYERRIRSLNAGTKLGQLRLMPLSSCIEHKTLLRICDYELQRPELEVTEEMWKVYFLKGRKSDTRDYARLAAAMRSLTMNTKLSDAESRVTRLLADFHSILDTEDMDDFPLEEPKLAVKYLCNALQPQALKTTVFTELKKTANKPLKKSVQAFINWLTPKVQAFCLFETALPDQAVSSRTGTSGNPASTPGKSGSQRDGTSKKQRSGHGQKNGPMPPRPAPQVPPAKLGSDTKHASPQQEKKCYKCGDNNHLVFQCPQVTREEALELVRERRKEGIGAVSSLPTARPVGSQLGQDKPTIACEINGTVSGHITPDTGTEYSIVAESLVNRLKMAKQWLPIRNLDARVKAEGFGGAVVVITQEVKLNLAVNTPAGKLLLTNVVCWISPEELPAGKGDVLLSRPLMRKLGYDPVEILAKARALNSVMDMEDVAAGVEGGLRHVMAVAARSDRLTTAPEEASFYSDEDQACFPTIARDRDLEAEQKEVWDALLKKIQEAEANGASVKYLKRLEKLLWEKVDTFRLKLGNDPPVDMPLFEVTLKPDAAPVRCKARRYPPEHREFMRQHVEELVAAGMVYRNPRSKWCSPPLIVNKKGPDPFRMTIDVRRVNTQTLRILWPMPMLEVILGYLYGSRYYFLLDFFKGYWQFLLSLSSQELFSFLTDMGVFTPTRVLMGGSDSVAYCQATVQEMFAEFLYKGLLIWLDDLLGYHATEDGIFTLLEAVLNVCETKGLKLNPLKCSFFLLEARWCGRIVSGDGVKHDPERIQALQAMPAPATGQELQQFVCALNWMRQSIPGYNKLMQPLMDLMEEVYQNVGGRTRRLAAKARLAEMGWNDEHQMCLDACKKALGDAVQLAHPDDSQRLSVFADASELHWGAVITQVPYEHLNRELAEQQHSPLMFLSGTFSGAARRWAIVEKGIRYCGNMSTSRLLAAPSGWFCALHGPPEPAVHFQPVQCVVRCPEVYCGKTRQMGYAAHGLRL